MTGLKSKLKREKLRAQVKSRWYYIFWGACTVSVFAGQLYVGHGFRRMADSMDRWFEETIDIITIPHATPDPWDGIYGKPDRMPIIK